MAEIEQLDAVVIGASTRGMVTAYVLDSLGYKTVLLERASDLGGGDGSFQLADGTWFDFGMHVLDEMRSRLATRLFVHAVDSQVRRTKLDRAIVLRSHVIPYAPQPADTPNEIREMLAADELVDEIGDALPTRDRLGAAYGRAFADFIFDEVLPSYPTEHRHLAFGVDEAELLANIYPWFFPRAKRAPKRGDISREFHDRLRAGIDQYVLYPLDGGFAEFSRGLARHLSPERTQIITGAKDIEIRIAPGSHTVEEVGCSGRRFRAAFHFWTSSWPELCGRLDIPCTNPATDRIVLGSFRLNRPPSTRFHEILVGDPRHQINRVHFPGSIRGSAEPLMQVEFAFPIAEDRPTEDQYWRDSWLESLVELGVLDRSHEVEIFDFKTRPIHFNGYGVEGERLLDADPSAIHPGSNIYPVVPSMLNLNLNAHIPRDVAYVTSVLANGR